MSILNPLLNSWKKLIAIALAIVLLVTGTSAWYALTHRGPLTPYASDSDHFKYASIGTEAVTGIPYWIWVVLPRLFPEKLPAAGGYTSLGLTWEEGNEMPVGLTKESIGIARVGMNCAICHVGTVRETPLSNPQFLLGAPSTKFDLQRYNQFLYDCANDPRFTAGFVLPEIEYNHHLSFIESQFYRFLVIPRARKALLKQEQMNHGAKNRPAFGPGRADLNALKINLLGLDDDQSIGHSDMADLWVQSSSAAYYHDGMNPSLKETVLSSAFRTGTDTKEINLESLERIENYLQSLSPPSYPFSIQESKAKQGATIFEQNCASCHGSKSGQMEGEARLSEVNTDPNRLNHWTQAAADGMNQVIGRYVGGEAHFRKTQSYVAPSLDGIWARAPYLHNGSVPNLMALLLDPSQRPDHFFRGFDVYDPVNVGFVTSGEEAADLGFEYQTTITGNSNQGHEFGTNLSQAEKESLIEYLKTL